MKNKFSFSSFLFVLALTMAFSVSALANHFHPVDISGPVTAYKLADCGQPGTITISGVTFKVAAGVDLAFLDNGVWAGNDGTIFASLDRSEAYQVVGSGRRIRVYVDSDGVIRMWVTVSTPTANRALSMTGIVTAVDSPTVNTFVMNGVTIKTAGPIAGLSASSNIVRISGAFNTSDQLQTNATVSTTPYDTVKVCAAAVSFSQERAASFEPIKVFRASNGAGIIGTGGTACDQFPGTLSFGLGGTIPFAANFTIPPTNVSPSELQCFELKLDQFSWITAGSQELPAGPASFSGTVVFYRAAPTFSTPTTLGEGNGTGATHQQGAIVLGGANGTIILTIGAKQSLINEALLTVGAKVSISPVFSPSGDSVGRLPGEAAPIRSNQLLNGSKVTLLP